MSNLAGLHDLSATKIASPGTWVLDTVALAANPTPPSYPTSVEMIVRLNSGYGSTGTIPVPEQYAAFAQKVANYVKGSRNCRRWIIGNEPNLPREWPDGRAILPSDYAACYRQCRAAIHALAGHEQDEVLVAASGPWNALFKYAGNDKGDWIKYFADVIAALGSEIDGFSIHAYTDGYNVAYVTSSQRMDAPFQDRRYHFRTYLDYVEAILDSLRAKPVYITEANGNGPWQAVGLMPAMLNEIDNYNKTGKSRIQCVIFYRFSHDDSYNIDGRDDVIKEYLVAVARGYTSPIALDTDKVKTMPDDTSPTSPAVPGRALPPRDISADFRRRVPTINLLPDTTTKPYYRLIKAEYVPDGARRFGPDHHILTEVLDENGKRQMGANVNFWWGSGFTNKPTDKPSGPYAVDYDMPNDGYSYGAKVNIDGFDSDSAFGMGLGTIEQPDWKIHVDYYLVFQKVMPTKQTPPPPSQPTQIAYVNAQSGANLRDTPKVGTVLVAVPYGEAVEVNGVQLVDAVPWKRVAYQGKLGWILGDLLSATKPAPPPITTPPTTQPSATLLWPVNGPISQRWGERPDFYQAKLNIPYHNGIDIAVPVGSPVVAAADGIVADAGTDATGYGLYCRLYLPAFRIHVFMGHLDAYLVKIGDQVRRGQVIARSGQSGMADGPHCHVEVRLGTQDAYALGTFGNGNGRVDPQAAYYLLGGSQLPGATK
jgi:murein DD-endopeptidase MepM/ murein hydrolase activator NlpD